MTQLQKYLLAARSTLPVAGVVAFSLCSTYSIFQLLTGKALHPSPLFWLPSVLVELVTAWAVHQCVTQFRRVVQSNISKQDRRFHLGILATFLVLTAPTLAASVWANTVEFGGLLLGLLYPVASVCCAISAALPGVAARYEKAKEAKGKTEQSKSKRKEGERKQREDAAQHREDILRNLGNEVRTYQAIAENPGATGEQLAQVLGISRRSVVNHLGKLEQVGLVRRNGNGIEVTNG